MAADARRYLLAGKGSITEQATWQGNMADRPDRPDGCARAMRYMGGIIISIQQLRQRWHERLAGWLACSGVPALAAPGLVPDDDGWMESSR